MYNPQKTTVSEQSFAILNAIRNESDIFRTSTPLVQNASDAKAFGEFVTGAGRYKELFWGILINRIALTLASGREFKNKLARFRRGKLNLGDIVQNVWVGLTLPVGWTSDVNNPGDVYAVNKPDAKVSMSCVNTKLSYSTSNNDVELSYAFTTEGGLFDMVSKIVERLMTSEHWDDYIMMKWVMAKNLIANPDAVVGMGEALTSQATADNLTAAMKEVVNDYPFMKTKYNEAHVQAPCPVEEIVFISTSKSRAKLDVYALSKAFNLTYEQFLGNEVQIDSFGFDDDELVRLYNILDIQVADGLLPAYTPFTDAELAYLQQITGAVIDQDWFMNWDRVYEMNSVYDARHLNNNTWLTIHRIYSYNPFANCTYFTEAAEPTVSLNKSTTTIAAGSNETLTATKTPNDSSVTVTWSSSDTAVATVTSAGKVTGVAAGTAVITAKATSLAGSDEAKCTVTITE